ncbi:MAG: hypothetical protein PHC75_04570 [Burkholderiales bacterium]|nr:hypothetical protein [Burkholderiales bacterium]
MNKNIALLPILITLAITGCNSGANTTSDLATSPANLELKLGEKIRFLREPVTEIKQVSGSILIRDKGSLFPADASPYNGNYLFSEVGAGTRPLVLIGTKYDVMTYLKNSKSKIENRLATAFNSNEDKNEETYSVKGIYIGVTPYYPEKNSMSLIYSPTKIGTDIIKEAMSAFGTSLVINELPVSAQYSDIFDAILGAIDIKTKNFSDKEKLKKFEKEDSQLYYFKFVPYKQDGFTKISDNKNEYCTDQLCSVNEIPKILGKMMNKDAK